MAKSLLVVESPTKMRTISKFLGNDFIIKATNGHIKDLPKSKIGVDIENSFTPQFEVLKGKAKTVEEIRKAGSQVECIYIGSDPDREGEAIAFHVAEAVGNVTPVKRVLFHEITRNGVVQAIKSPTDLDVQKYDAQRARRILDRLVGYRISPLLWEKVKYGLSAGRVQSVALRIVCEREDEIGRFVREEFWIVEVALTLESGEVLRAVLDRKGGDKIRVGSGDQAEAIKADIANKVFLVLSQDVKEKSITPQPPFITSRLQQEAARRLRFAPKKTMMLAQRLYEGIEIGDEERTGLITYMRTDSVRVSSEAVGEARKLIEGSYGKAYLPKTPNVFKNKKAQDAHEAIRPTYVNLTPETVKPHLDKDLFALYDLIWKRFIASQMVKERVESKTIEIGAGDYVFVARGRRVLFDGFTRIYEETEEDTDEVATLPAVSEGERPSLAETTLSQRFTNPPPRYTEASLIKVLETKGIGRPSTYANIVSTIQDRSYVTKEGGRLAPTPLGKTVNSLMVEFFPIIVDVHFTAQMEERLDLIEEGKKNWIKSLQKFNHFLDEELDQAKERMKDLKKEERRTDIVCDRCGGTMLLRWGKNGEYLVCENKASCKNKKNITRDPDGNITIAEADVRGLCPACGGNLIEKTGKFGRFLACSNYPACKHTEPYSLGLNCPVEGCSGKLVEKTSKKKKRFVSCSRYPSCTFATSGTPVEGPCPQCSAPSLFTFRKRTICLRKDCGWKSP